MTFDLCGSIIQLKGGKRVMMKETLIKLTKYLLDFMFYAGIVVTASLPITIKMLGAFSEKLHEHYVTGVIIYFVLGIAAIVILRELRKMFRTVVNKDCFVRENVVILVFTIAGLFSKVLSFVFEEAVGYKEENDFTI